MRLPPYQAIHYTRYNNKSTKNREKPAYGLKIAYNFPQSFSPLGKEYNSIIFLFVNYTKVFTKETTMCNSSTWEEKGVYFSTFRYSSSGDGFYLKKDSIRHNIYARHKLPNFGISSLPRKNTRCEIPTGFTLPCSFSYPPGRSRLSGRSDIFGQETLDIVK